MKKSLFFLALLLSLAFASCGTGGSGAQPDVEKPSKKR